MYKSVFNTSWFNTTACIKKLVLKCFIARYGSIINFYVANFVSAIESHSNTLSNHVIFENFGLNLRKVLGKNLRNFLKSINIIFNELIFFVLIINIH